MPLPNLEHLKINKPADFTTFIIILNDMAKTLRSAEGNLGQLNRRLRSFEDVLQAPSTREQLLANWISGYIARALTSEDYEEQTAVLYELYEKLREDYLVPPLMRIE